MSCFVCLIIPNGALSVCDGTGLLKLQLPDNTLGLVLIAWALSDLDDLPDPFFSLVREHQVVHDRTEEDVENVVVDYEVEREEE